MGNNALIFREYHNFHHATLTYLSQHLAIIALSTAGALLLIMLLSSSVSKGMAPVTGHLTLCFLLTCSVG